MRRFLALAALALFLAAALVTGESGLLAHLRLRVYHAELSERIAQRMEENHRLSIEVERLRSDRLAQEALARVNLGMVRPGERVYLLPEERGR